MSVSVVISVRNGEPYIAETIASVVAQGDCVKEIIVVNDLSTDDTEGAALSLGDPRVRVIPASRRGLPAGRNCGVEVSTGEWLYFVDADDIVQPGALDRLLAAAAEHPDAGLVYGDYDRIRQDGSALGRRTHFMSYRRKPSGDVLEDIVRKNFMVLGAQIVKREVYDRCGSFHEPLKVADDWHFWCLAAAHTRFHFVPGIYVLSYRMRDNSIMHTRPIPFEAVAPAIDAVYREPAIVDRLDAATLSRCRRRAESTQMSNIASVSVRLGAYVNGLKMIARSIRRDPAGAPRATVQFAGAFVGL
jgi:glycosyltransferase involved in cell wall biosynthesis